MWIFLNDAFLSIVADRGDADRLLVRARAKGEIESVFPNASVSHTPDADYAYRAFLSRRDAAATIERRVQVIDYPNFKGSVRDSSRHDAFMAVWRVMLRYQEGPGDKRRR